MDETIERLQRLSQERCPGWQATEEAWSKIEKGGSDRVFYRVAGERPCVVIAYSDDRKENALYETIARFLRGLGVRVPEFWAHDVAQRVMWVEELGQRDLFSLAGGDRDVRRAGWEAALDAVLPLHVRGYREWLRAPFELMPSFDRDLYLWERTYFLENFVGRFCGLSLGSDAAGLEEELAGLADSLMQSPPCLIHRDFQSQNILLRGEQAWLIDFQGMRVGCAAYDLASLLYDPYVRIEPHERIALLRYYLSAGGGEVCGADPARLFHQAGAQRLMQALGAYGFLGLVKAKPSFLQHIPSALRHIQEATQICGCLPRLAELIGRCSDVAAKKL